MSKIADKSIAGNLMTELTSMKFDWSVPIHDHCDQMVQSGYMRLILSLDFGVSIRPLRCELHNPSLAIKITVDSDRDGEDKYNERLIVKVPYMKGCYYGASEYDELPVCHNESKTRLQFPVGIIA
nr:reverse transcriptase [Ipomoea batatas]